jgi:hypothetical protein
MKPLDNIGKENPFKVPDGYFENLTERMMISVKESRETTGKTAEMPSRRFRLTSFIALAAAIIGFAVITAGVMKIISGNNKGMGIKDSGELFTEALNEDIDTYMIENELIQSTAEFKEEPQVPAGVIIEYLLLEDVDLNDIYELL